MTPINPNITTLSAFSREVSKVIARMSYSEKAALRLALSLKTPGLRERILN
jgi:hypothetical protein